MYRVERKSRSVAATRPRCNKPLSSSLWLSAFDYLFSRPPRGWVLLTSPVSRRRLPVTYLDRISSIPIQVAGDSPPIAAKLVNRSTTKVLYFHLLGRSLRIHQSSWVDHLVIPTSAPLCHTRFARATRAFRGAPMNGVNLYLDVCNPSSLRWVLPSFSYGMI